MSVVADAEKAVLKAEEELIEAQQDLLQVEKTLEELKDHERHDITLVAPSGAELKDRYHSHHTVKQTRDDAVVEFVKEGQLDGSVGADAYLLVLGDTPLENNLTLEQAGVKPGDKLKLRSKAIPGDGDASQTE